jgi:DNA-binding transcriptional LysR family regulator
MDVAMRDHDFREMTAFLSVAEHLSFTKAADALGTSRANLSSTIRALEERLGVRLLNRTTRSVAVTEAGERLLTRLRPLLDDYASTLESINDFRDKPAGHLRLTVAPSAARSLIGRLTQFMRTYPDIHIEISADAAYVDIVEHHFDAGIHVEWGLDRDMIAVPLNENYGPMVIGAPSYLAARGQPETPQDLLRHNCMRLRTSDGTLAPWRFQGTDRKEFEVPVSGTLIFNEAGLFREPVREGIGLMYIPRGWVSGLLEQGAVVPLLEDFIPRRTNFVLYYPSRRQTPAALKALIDFLRKPVS